MEGTGRAAGTCTACQWAFLAGSGTAGRKGQECPRYPRPEEAVAKSSELLYLNPCSGHPIRMFSEQVLPSRASSPLPDIDTSRAPAGLLGTVPCDTCMSSGTRGMQRRKNGTSVDLVQVCCRTRSCPACAETIGCHRLGSEAPER